VFAVVFAIVAAVLWGFEGTGWPIAVMIGLAALCLILSVAGFRSWRRSVAVLSRGQLARATITAMQVTELIETEADRGAMEGTISVKWHDFQNVVESINRRVSEYGWDKLRRQAVRHHSRFQFRVPDSGVVTSEAKVDFGTRYALHSTCATDIAVYDPRDPKRAFLLSSFHPPLNVSVSGEWKQGAGQIDFAELLSSGRT
jgi:hypothetical protein